MGGLLEQRINPSIFQAIDTVGIYLRIRQKSYEGAKQRAEPYPKIVEELAQMRRETVQLVRQVVGRWP